jgi:hypothetical protein
VNQRRCRNAALSLAISSLLLASLFVLLDEVPQTARAHPGDWFVKVDGSGSSCAQSSPCALATALSLATDGEAIYLAQGTYTGSGAAVVIVTESISLFGGWDGSTTTPPVQDPELYPTTIDGQNARRGVSISGDISPTLDGFIIARGNATNAATDPGRGGGINSNGADPIITNNVITNNVARADTTDWGHGGGIYIHGSYSARVTAVVSGNLIANNRASAAGRGKGGGLEVEYGRDVVLSNNTFQGNTAGGGSNGMGGGVSLYYCSAVVSGNSIQSNQATPGDHGFGAGFQGWFEDIVFSRNIVIGNAGQYGAVTFQSNASVTLTNNIIAQNPAGGLFVRGAASSPFAGVLAHNTIAQNGKEGVYAGFYSSGYSTLAMINNIIVHNTAGIYAYPHANPNVVTATHTLFYGNEDDTGGSIITSTNEIVGSNPLFVNPAGWDYHVLADSPAIDAAAPVPWLTTDIDGDARPLPAGGDCDIGADEAHWSHVHLPLVLRSSG